MTRRSLGPLVLATFLAACTRAGPAGPGPRTEPPPPDAAPGAAAPEGPVEDWEEEGEADDEPLTEDQVRLGDSPLTPFAERLAALALAAIRGEPLPDVGIPVRPPMPGQEEVSYEPGVGPPLPPIRIVAAIIAGVDIGFQGYTGPQSMLVDLIVTRSGLRVFDVMTHEGRPCIGLTPGDPLHGASEGIVAAIRDGDASVRFGRVECMELLHSEPVCFDMERGRAGDREIEEVREALASAGAVAGVAFRAATLVAEDPTGRILGLAIDFECDSGAMQIRSSPLLTVMPPPSGP